jgi:hypothetical protein
VYRASGTEQSGGPQGNPWPGRPSSLDQNWSRRARVADALKIRVRADALQARVREVYDALPPDAAAEFRAALWRLRKARSPRQAVAALEHEIEHLFAVVAPTLAQHPLPIHTTRRAVTVVTLTAGTAAMVEEMEAIALMIPGVQTAAAPSLSVVVASAFAALLLEAYVAGSLRVHIVRAAGHDVDPSRVAREVFQAMTGHADVRITKLAAQALARRMLRRWARAIVPVVGVSWAAWDARKTVAAISRMPIRVQPEPVAALTPPPRHST